MACSSWDRRDWYWVWRSHNGTADPCPAPMPQLPSGSRKLKFPATRCPLSSLPSLRRRDTGEYVGEAGVSRGVKRVKMDEWPPNLGLTLLPDIFDNPLDPA